MQRVQKILKSNKALSPRPKSRKIVEEESTEDDSSDAEVQGASDVGEMSDAGVQGATEEAATEIQGATDNEDAPDSSAESDESEKAETVVETAASFSTISDSVGGSDLWWVFALVLSVFLNIMCEFLKTKPVQRQVYSFLVFQSS
jgi:negative regulator of genetic competence, sporulation and motility